MSRTVRRSALLSACLLIIASFIQMASAPQVARADVVSPYFWPFPAEPPQSNRQNRTYWWSYDWYRGAGSPTTGCPASATDGVQITATFFATPDGAFGDTATNTNDLVANDTNTNDDFLAVDYYKSNPCMYLSPGNNSLGRMYATGVQGAVGDSTPYLSFRGFSFWEPRTDLGSTVFKYNGGAVVSSPVRFWGTRADGTSAFLGGSRFEIRDSSNVGINRDNYNLPNYAFVSNSFTNNVNLYMPGGATPSGYATTQYNCEYRPSSTAYAAYQWSQMQTNGLCNLYPETWRVYLRTATIWWDGAYRSAQYVGYAENWSLNGIPNGFNCEEWWFVPGYGPVIMAQHAISDSLSANDKYLTCVNTRLAAGSSNPQQSMNDPLGHLSWHAANGSLYGYLVMHRWCLDYNLCTVQW